MSTIKKRQVKDLKYKVDTKFIKEFILKTFQWKRTKKPFSIYKQLIIIYNYHPKIIEDIFTNISKLGYWKDCMFALLAAKALVKKNIDTKKFSDYIYDLLIRTIDCDNNNFANRKNISTLAKWLPRENGSFDKKLNFVDNFTAFRYEKVNFNVDKFNLIKRKVDYRKEKSKLNKYLGTAEINFSNLEILYNIDFNKISPICVKKHRTRIIEDPILLEKYKESLFHKYCQTKFWQFINMLIKLDQNIEKEVAERAWLYKLEDNKKELEFLNIDDNYDIVIELSNNIISENFIKYNIGVILLVKAINPDTKIFCIGKSREILFPSLNIFDIIQTLNKNIFPFIKDIEYNFRNKKLLIIATEPISTKIDHKYWFLKDVICFTKDNNIIGLPYIKDNICAITINKILNKYPEFREPLAIRSINHDINTYDLHISIIMVLIMIFLLSGLKYL